MLRISLALLCILHFVTSALAQPKILSGTIRDTSLNKPLALASVSLLRAADSVLLASTRTNTAGKFSITLPSLAKAILLVTYPKYADYTMPLNEAIPGDITVDMITQAVLLQEVIVRGTAAIKMRGDTLSFTADSFKVQEGATVEDLLRRLPGLSVNAAGEITAQGQKVQKVLVDGDEFFGDDPTLATRNLQANAVKEVQVFDKKSDQSAFTGVSDGNEQKTINLKLKDDFKKGYFGKVKMGGGLPKRYEAQNMLNAFRAQRKFSVYVIGANTGNTLLNWSEENQFGGNINSETIVGDDGTIYFNSSGDEFGGIGGFYGEGLPSSLQVGSSYANKWNADRSKLNAATRFQQMNIDAQSRQRTQYQLPDTQFYQNQNSNRFTDRWQTKAVAKADIYIDSLNTIIVDGRGSFGKSMINETFYSETIDQKGININTSDRSTKNNNTSGNAQVGVTWNKKFRTKGRTISASLNYGNNTSDGDGFLYTANRFFADTGTVTEIVDQKKVLNNFRTEYRSRVAYTEPFGKRAIVEINYSYARVNSEQERLSYDKAGNDYTLLNTRFSNSFDFATITNRGGVNYAYNKDKLKLSFGSDVSYTDWEQKDRFKDTIRNYGFTNLFPKANFNYKLGTYSSIRLRYDANTQAPSINQLQPVQDNTDPLNIIIGNPDLRVAFQQNFNVSYNFYQVLKNRGLWSNIWYAPVSNAFSISNQVDASGRRVQQAINVKGNYTLGFYGGYNQQFKQNTIGFDIFFNPSLSRFTNRINGVENTTRNNNYRIEGGVSVRKEKKYYFYNRFEAGYNTSANTVRPDQNIKYWSGLLSTDMNVELPKRFFVMSYLSYEWRQKTEQFPDNNNLMLWNITLENKLSKKKDMRVGIRVNDVLNNRFGFNRNIQSNFVSERTWNVIRRYWLLTFSWNFHKGPQKPEGDFNF